MKHKGVVLACSLSLIFAFGACKKKEKAPEPQAAAPGQEQALPPGHQGVMPKGETSVVVPESVKGKWKAVVIAVEDKGTKKTQEFTVDLNSELKIPNSNLKIAVGDFLPDFRMEGLNITSLSNEPNNPAVRIKIFENDQEIFKGWLYSKFPMIHPFEHQKFGIQMKSGVKKG